MAVSMVSAIRIDEFFDFSSARRWAHQRSASDSIAFLESPLILDEECQNPTATMMHHHGYQQPRLRQARRRAAYVHVLRRR
ncbi:hypothetical protein ACFX1T_013056 [Malus domestica]